MSPKGPPLSFLLFCYRMRVYKSKRVPPFTFFGTVRHFPKEIFFLKNFKFFPKKNVLRFLSLRYSADLRRSRLVFIYCLDRRKNRKLCLLLLLTGVNFELCNIRSKIGVNQSKALKQQTADFKELLSKCLLVWGVFD